MVIHLVQQPATLLCRDHHASKLLEKKLIRKNLQKNFALNQLDLGARVHSHTTFEELLDIVTFGLV